MIRRNARVLVAVVAAFALVAAVATIVLASRDGAMHVFTGRFAWIAPVLAGVVVGLLSWFLLSEPTSRATAETPRRVVHCDVCGTEVLSDWRLCPYCGGARERTSPDHTSKVDIA